MDAEEILIAVDDEVKVVLHHVSHEFKSQGIDANALENFVYRTSKVGGTLGKSLLLPNGSEKGPHRGGLND